MIKCSSTSIGPKPLTIEIGLRQSPSNTTWGICRSKQMKSAFLKASAYATIGWGRY